MILKDSTPIQTINKTIKVYGKVFYNDRRRRIEVKTPIRDLFFDDGNSSIGYVMELCFNTERIVQRIKELSGKKIIPILMYFTKEKVGKTHEKVS